MRPLETASRAGSCIEESSIYLSKVYNRLELREIESSGCNSRRITLICNYFNLFLNNDKCVCVCVTKTYPYKYYVYQ